MSNLLRIEPLNLSEPEEEKELTEIRLEGNNIIELNFPKFYILSKYLQEKYKYSEGLNSIQSEIEMAKEKLQINSDIIKHFIKFIQTEEASISIEQYKGFYKLSEYFIIPKFIKNLSEFGKEALTSNIEFAIQVILDTNLSNSQIEANLQNKVETFLSNQINECLKIENFSKLPISIICRILLKSNKEDISTDLLVDLILGSVETRFSLFKFVEIRKLTEIKIGEMIEFLDKQNEQIRNICLDYLPFDLLFVKQMLAKCDSISEQFSQTKQELDQTKQDLDQTKQELDQTKIKLEEALAQQSELKKAQIIIVAGYNRHGQLFENSTSDIEHPQLLSINPSSLLSYSVYFYHTVYVTKNGQIFGAGYNGDGRICGKLNKERISHFVEFSINDRDGSNLVPVSAVCSGFGTLYMFTKSSSKSSQLVLCDCRINSGEPIFLDIGGKEPSSLFSGYIYVAAISSEGEVILFNSDSIKNSPNSPIPSFSLPDGEKATSVAFCQQALIALSSSGKVFLSPIQSQSCILNFSSVNELANYEIVCLSGSNNFCLAVSKEGLAFAFGSNDHGQLGLGEETSDVSTFTIISSLSGREIRAAYAGYYHSFFEPSEGKILACGWDSRGELFLNGGKRNENVYSPTETIIDGSKFIILGAYLSAVFIGGDPPPNTPNMRMLV